MTCCAHSCQGSLFAHRKYFKNSSLFALVWPLCFLFSQLYTCAGKKKHVYEYFYPLFCCSCGTEPGPPCNHLWQVRDIAEKVRIPLYTNPNASVWFLSHFRHLWYQKPEQAAAPGSRKFPPDCFSITGWGCAHCLPVTDSSAPLTFQGSGNPLRQQLHTNTQRISVWRQDCSPTEHRLQRRGGVMGWPFLQAARRTQRKAWNKIASRNWGRG